MPHSTNISVVIPNHDYGRFLPGCLEALARQDVDMAGVEVLLVDDASTDGSAALARRLLPGMPFGAWRVLELPRQGRPGPVRNAGLELARGEFLLCLDPDDKLLPGFLATGLAALEDGGADVAYGGYVLHEGRTLRKVTPPDYAPALLASQNILPPTALMRRRVWDLGARFRADTAYEDWDFWIQAALLGGRFARVEGAALYLHRQHGANYSVRARAQDGRAKALIVAENPGFFPPHTRAWARGLLRGEPWARQGPRGLIPLLRQDTGLAGLPNAAGQPGLAAGGCSALDPAEDFAYAGPQAAAPEAEAQGTGTT